MKRHYFIALPIRTELKLFLQQKVELLRTQYQFKRWVHTEDYHLTLAFLGSADPEVLKRCWKACEEALRDQVSFTMELNKFGVFGRAEQPRIFWSAPELLQELITLQHIIYGICRQHDFVLDERPFNPHITLARKYCGETVFSESDLQFCNSLLKGAPSFSVEGVALFETIMEQEPKYIIKEYLQLK